MRPLSNGGKHYMVLRRNVKLGPKGDTCAMDQSGGANFKPRLKAHSSRLRRGSGD